MNATLATRQRERFDRLYQRRHLVYGSQPSRGLLAAIVRYRGRLDGRALDLGAGLGRNAITLAHLGFQVTAIDISRQALRRLRRTARIDGVGHRLNARARDVRHLRMLRQAHDVVVAATLLDHLPEQQGRQLMANIARLTAPDGIAFFEVHTADDPGAQGARRRHDEEEVEISETAEAVQHYFPSGELVAWAEPHFKVLRYREFTEWDFTHGNPHRHAKAVLVGRPLIPN